MLLTCTDRILCDTAEPGLQPAGQAATDLYIQIDGADEESYGFA